MDRYDVLIAGAGPTGMVLALALAKQGIRVCIVDQAEGPGTTSRAMAVQARTLELYRPLGLADEVAAAGRPNPCINLWVRGKRRAQLSLRDAGARLTPYPYVLIYPQDAHEQLLVRHLEAAGVSVLRRTELAGFEEQQDHVLASLRQAGGADLQVEARYLAGCDGARSFVRRQLGTGFGGGTYDHIFYVADVQSRGQAANGEIHLSLETSDFVIFLGYDDRGRGRLVGTIRDTSGDERGDAAGALSFKDVSHRAMASLGLEVDEVYWFSTYRVHHRVSDHYRKGRAFLLGDAAHVHSPAGGQGMNTGIGDAINLAWKLAAVVRGDAPDSLLDTYEKERIAFARKLVDTTRPPVQLRHGGERFRRLRAHPHRSDLRQRRLRGQAGARDDLPDPVADHDQLPRQPAVERRGRPRAWRRPPALGGARGGRQLRAAGPDRLAGARLRPGLPRPARLVRPPRHDPARIRMGSGTRTGRLLPQCRLPAAAGRLRGAVRPGRLGAGAGRLFLRPRLRALPRVHA